MARNWGSLSNDYRKRLQRAGITQGDYEAGSSLANARGHAQTPERPERAERNPKKYGNYLQRRASLVNDIIRLKTEKFYGKEKYLPSSNRKAANNDPYGKSHSVDRLIRVKKALADHENWQDIVAALNPRMMQLSNGQSVNADSTALFYH